MLWLAAGAEVVLVWPAGNEASACRARIEGGILTMYHHHTVSFGLRVVPGAGRIGAVAVGALAVMTFGIMVARRSAVSGRG